MVYSRATPIGARPMRGPEDRRLSAFERAFWGSLAVGGVAVLVAASLLEPDARGYGTHTQLGLPPCGFLTLTGLPCPGCGLTTAFAHGVRGDWWLAGASNPLGLALFLLVVGAIPVSILALCRGWTFTLVSERLSLHRWGLGLAASALVLWCVRFAAAF